MIRLSVFLSWASPRAGVVLTAMAGGAVVSSARAVTAEASPGLRAASSVFTATWRTPGEHPDQHETMKQGNKHTSSKGNVDINNDSLELDEVVQVGFGI